MEYEKCKGENQFDDEHHICTVRDNCLRYSKESKNNFFDEDKEKCEMFVDIFLIDEET